MGKLVVSIHSTANDTVTGSPSGDEIELYWAQAGIEDSLAWFLELLVSIDTILLARATYEDLATQWPKEHL